MSAFYVLGEKKFFRSLVQINISMLLYGNENILTRIASISLSDTGVRLGCRDAFPPTAVFMGVVGTSELGMEISRLSPFLVAAA